MIFSFIGLRVPGSKPVHDVTVLSLGSSWIPIIGRHKGRTRSSHSFIFPVVAGRSAGIALSFAICIVTPLFVGVKNKQKTPGIMSAGGWCKVEFI